MHSALITGSMPGMAASTSDTCEVGAPPNSAEAPEKSLARDVTWAWTSRPTTTSQSPVAPLISFEDLAGASMARPAPVFRVPSFLGASFCSRKGFHPRIKCGAGFRRNMRLQEIEDEAERGNRLPASALAVEQRRHDDEPFRLERARRGRFFRLPIPLGD